MTDNDRSLEQRLARLPEEMAFPPTPDIASQIGHALPERPRSGSWRRPSAWMYAGAALLLVAILLAFPGPRNAVADLFGLPGIRIEFGERGTTDEKPASIGSALLFGEATTLEDVAERAPFAIAVPDQEGLREPDEVWLRADEDVAMVTLIYASSEALPEIGDTGVGVLLMEIQAAEEAPLLAKRVMGDGNLSIVNVNNRDAFWVENGELVVLGAPAGDTGRPSANVLIWADGDTTYRLESDLGVEDAIGIAESLAPYSDGN